MYACADSNRARRQRFGQLSRGGEGGGRRLEGKEERVALRIDLDPAVVVARTTYNPPVSLEDMGVRVVPELVEQLAGTLDVGEEKRDGAGRECLAHS